ncbi:MAG: methionine synthase [Clostridia bacterium]|nr:methionine synthase [Clostridia bacterium]
MGRLREETLRYLGYGKNPATAGVSEIIDECERELYELPTVRYIYRIFDDLMLSEGGVTLGGTAFESRALASHLRGCERAAILCATLGSAADMTRLRLERLDMSRAVVMDAAQSAYIEEVCDRACKEMLSRVSGEGFYLTSRFSPGYGDMPLSYQPVILSVMDAPKRIGLTCSETNMLTPQKSVTAIIGITKNAQKCGAAACDICSARETCRFKKT